MYSTSPSIYVAFSSLFANNSCTSIGSAYLNITLSFAPTHFMTGASVTPIMGKSWMDYYVWTTMRTEDLTGWVDPFGQLETTMPFAELTFIGIVG